jgi:hypothetical protein
MACGGGGSGAYRKPPKPAHHHGETKIPMAEPIQLPDTREHGDNNLTPKSKGMRFIEIKILSWF